MRLFRTPAKSAMRYSCIPTILYHHPHWKASDPHNGKKVSAREIKGTMIDNLRNAELKGFCEHRLKAAKKIVRKKVIRKYKKTKAFKVLRLKDTDFAKNKVDLKLKSRARAVRKLIFRIGHFTAFTQTIRGKIC